ncbi:PSD12 [Enterospora canceri]|uniref:PSD12 n=1 Tax=Enterospora canceri TaxID=1081671 RepID=A0A1Y1S7V2_9MICR|nr:PSD12 [Enterospora canceri]
MTTKQTNAPPELFEKERVARTENNVDDLQAIQFVILQTSKTEDELITNLKILQNKRKQNHVCFKKLIEYAVGTNETVGFLEKMLNEVVAGKMYLESERVAIVEKLEKLHLKQNNTVGAYEVLSSVPIETFTSVDERKKNEILFETFRLGFMLKKHVECELTLRKIRQVDLTKEEKIRFLNYKIFLLVAQGTFLGVARMYMELIAIERSQKNVVLGSYYAIIANSFYESSCGIKEERNRLIKEYAEHTMNSEQMRVVLVEFWKTSILNKAILKDIKVVVQQYEAKMEFNEEALLNALHEHNFNAIQTFFTKATLKEIAFLMQINEDEAVEFISRAVNEKIVAVKIDQENGMVDLGPKRWNDKVDGVLDRIIDVNHIIEMETME